MIDIETLGRRADAAILQIGVVAFTGATFVWWINQSKEAQQNLLGGELSQREALKWLSYFIPPMMKAR